MACHPCVCHVGGHGKDGDPVAFLGNVNYNYGVVFSMQVF